MSDVETSSVCNLIETAKIWNTDNDSAIGIFATMEIIIDNQHRDLMIGELKTKMEMVEEYSVRLAMLVREKKSLQNLINFVRKSEIVIDYDR